MEHIKNTFKVVLIISYLALTIFNLALTTFGVQIFMIDKYGYYPILITIIIFIINLLLLKKTKIWLNFLENYFDNI